MNTLLKDTHLNNRCIECVLFYNEIRVYERSEKSIIFRMFRYETHRLQSDDVFIGGFE